MKSALHITSLYLRMTYSSRAVLIFQVLMPLVFTFLIGQATGGFGGDGASSTTVVWTLNVANEDEGALGSELIAALDADPTLDVQETDAETAVTAVRDDDAIAGLIIPANFSALLQKGENPTLDYYVDPADTQQAQPVEQAILSAASRLSGSVTAAAVSTDVAERLGLFELDVARDAYFAEGVAQAQTAWTEPPVVVQVNEDEIITQAENVIPQGINQSSPGMMAMFATFGMVGGAAVLIQERQAGTLRRLLVMPIRKGSILLGKMLGILLTGIVQMLILIAAGALFFGVPWGNSPLALALVVLSFGLAITGLGMMLAALTKTLAQANAISTVIVLSISALGGAWWPLDIVPGWMQTLGRFSPISWAMTGFHDVITRELGVTAVLPEVGVLLAFTAVFFTIGVWRFRYE